MQTGLRLDGGIGESFKEVSYTHEQSLYIGKFLFVLLYFIILIVILLAIVFGIVIDAFSELREEHSRIDNDKMNICFICGDSRSNLEKDGNLFSIHYEKDHNIWNYIDYMIGLKLVDVQETNAINSYVIDLIEKKSIAWLPAVVDKV